MQQLKKLIVSSIILLNIVSLQGCVWNPTKPDIGVINKTVYVDKSVLEQCESLNEFPQGIDYNGILALSIDNARIYKSCKDKQATSIELLKKLGVEPKK
jgi:hypothetical protein